MGAGSWKYEGRSWSRRVLYQRRSFKAPLQSTQQLQQQRQQQLVGGGPWRRKPSRGSQEVPLAGPSGRSEAGPAASEGAVGASAASAPAPEACNSSSSSSRSSRRRGGTATAGAGGGEGGGTAGTGSREAEKKTQVAADIGNLCFRALAGDGIQFEAQAANAFSEDVSLGMLAGASFRINGAQVLDSLALDIRSPCAAPVSAAPMAVAQQLGELNKGTRLVQGRGPGALRHSDSVRDFYCFWHWCY